MAIKKKQGTFERMGQTVVDAAKTAVSVAEEYVVEPVGNFLGLTDNKPKARAKKTPAGKTPRKSPMTAGKGARKRPATAKAPAKRAAKAKTPAKRGVTSKRPASARRPAKAKRK